MIYRCQKETCPHYVSPCELSEIEYEDMWSARSSVCPIGEGNPFEPVKTKNEFFALIGGTRTYNNYKEFCHYLDVCLKNKQDKNIVVVTGDAKGADALARRYAKENGYKLYVFRANWNEYGKKAGPLRNKQMFEFVKGENCGCLLFWDGLSRGTKTDIEFADQYHVQKRVIKI